MNLLVLSINYAPEPTGFAPHVTDLCEYLAGRRHNVTVLTGFPFAPYWKRYDGYAGKPVTFESVNGVELVRLTHFIPRKPSSTLQRILMEGTFCLAAGMVLMRFGRSQWDVVLYVGAQPSLAMLAKLIGNVKKIPYVVAINDLAAQAAGDTGIVRTGLVRGVLAKFEYSAYSGASGAMVLCESFRDALRKSGYPDEKIRMIRSPINIDNIHPTKDKHAFRRWFGIAEKSFVVLWAGSMGIKQGLTNIVEACKLLKGMDVSVLWVLVGNGEARFSLEAEVREWNLGPYVRLLPFQAENRLSDMFSAADVLLLNQLSTVKNTVIPSKLLTYMAAGRPVLAAINANSQGAKLLREAGGGVIVEPENPTALVEGLKGLMCDERVLKEMGERNRRYAVEHFDRKEILRTQEGFLMDIVGRPSPSETSYPAR
jgi:colanic acid biosynthesis glycosyl transferase WcaI